MALRDDDELLHSAPDPLPDSWQENLFFICWDLAGNHGLMCHIQRVPGRHVQEAQVVVAIGGEVASTTITSSYQEASLVPGVRATPVEPFRAWQFSLDATGAKGPGPLGFVAVLPSDGTPIEADLALESVLPVADFATGLAELTEGMRANASGPQMGDQQHYEQGGTWRGRIRIGDHQVQAEGLFVRDHSWGVRHEHQDFKAFWTASCLDHGRLFCNAIGIPQGNRVLGIGAIADRNGIAFTKQVSAAFSPTPGVASYDRTTVDFGWPVTRSLTAETRMHVPLLLRFSGPRRYDSNGISAVRMGEAAGFGVMEWAAVLTAAELAQVEAPAIAKEAVAP